MSTFLTGFKGFVRHNPKSDIISAKTFHHVEFYVGDASSTYRRFQHALGMEVVAKTDQSTGNHVHCSYVLQTGETRMVITAPYHPGKEGANQKSEIIPSFDGNEAAAFFQKHGLAVKAIGVETEDVFASYEAAVNNGGKGLFAPVKIEDKDGKGYVEFAEIEWYGEVALRFINTKNFTGAFLPNFSDVIPAGRKVGKYGLTRFDHMVGNVWALEPVVKRIMKMTGFHDFAEFVSEDVGTVDSGLNSIVLANNSEYILLPINEPTFGTRRKSQIQTYLEQNQGEGVQHLAIMTENIYDTMRKMREAGENGGFEFMDGQGEQYYQNVRKRLAPGDLSEEQILEAQKLGLLIDRDDQGVLLQIFTKPLGDRPTIFIEIIQRIGCMETGVQKAGCGGFGKGNFGDLFKSIEAYETALKIN